MYVYGYGAAADALATTPQHIKLMISRGRLQAFLVSQLVAGGFVRADDVPIVRGQLPRYGFLVSELDSLRRLRLARVRSVFDRLSA